MADNQLTPNGLKYKLFHTLLLRTAAAIFVLHALDARTVYSQDWITFTDQSCRIVTDDSDVGLNDVEEKDIVTGDLDGDGDDDLIIVRKFPFSSPGGRRNVLYMNEGGIMVDRTSDLAPRFLDETDDRDVVIALINDDLLPDVITAPTFNELPRVYINLGNDVNGQWLGLHYDETEQRIPPFDILTQFCGVAAGDLDDDGDNDLYFVDYGSNEDHLMINDGNGFFTDETGTRMTTEMYTSDSFGTGADIRDIDNDGFNDIIKSQAGDVSVFYNDPNNAGHFVELQLINDAFGPYAFAAGDLNNDDHIDILSVNDDDDTYYLNQGDREFSDPLFILNSPYTNGIGGNAHIVDMDGDTFRDALVSDVDVDIPYCDRHLVIAQNQADIPNITLLDPFGGASRPWLTQGTYDTGVFDFIPNVGPLVLWTGTCSGNKLFVEGNSIEDCNTNTVSDICDISNGTSEDCNCNEIPDECDIASGTSADTNSNGIPDECDTIEGACCFADATCNEMTAILCSCNDGFFNGEGTDCSSLGGLGACCLGSGGGCEIETSCSCGARGGTFLGALNCNLQPRGACCFGTTCQPFMKPCDCINQGGLFVGAGTTCTLLQCQQFGPQGP